MLAPVSPNTKNSFPSGLDGFEHLAVIGSGVRVREGPDTGSPVVATLSVNVVARGGISPQSDRLPRALVREGGRWRLAFFVGCD